MKTLKSAALPAVGLVVAICLVGCAYRLPAYNLPSRHRLRIVTSSPEHYAIRIQGARTPDYQVPADGRITIDVPTFARACSIYFLGWIRIGRGLNPLTTKAIHVIAAGKTARRLSVTDISHLPTDAEGYRLLKIRR